MPTLDELTKKSKKKFTKSEYRPWNYLEEIDKESIGNLQEINKDSVQDGVVINEKSTSNQLEIISAEPHNSTQKINTRPLSTDTEIKKNDSSISLDNLLNRETTLDIIFRLTGHQMKIFTFIVDRCMSRGMLLTGVIKGETLIDLTGTTIKMIKTSIQRLISKGLINRERGKSGRGGFYSFSVNELVRNAAIEYKRMVGIENQMEIKRESNNNLIGIENRISVGKKKKFLLPEWENINFSPLEDIGFNYNHLSDIHETGLADHQMVQDSILHFAFGIEYEPVKYKQYDDLLNVFIGRLRKGKPWYEPNYRSPQELAQQMFLENKKTEIERKKLLEEDAFKVAFIEWQQSLRPDELDKIAPAKREAGVIMPQSAKLSLYFKEKIWPEKKSEYIVS